MCIKFVKTKKRALLPFSRVKILFSSLALEQSVHFDQLIWEICLDFNVFDVFLINRYTSSSTDIDF